MRICTWFGPAEATVRSVGRSGVHFATASLIGVTLFACPAPAQDDDDAPRRSSGDRAAERWGGDREVERWRGRMPGAPPLIAALDQNRDGRLDQEEIEQASAALRSLDRDEDGVLTRDEILPRYGRGPAARRGGADWARRNEMRRRRSAELRDAREERRDAPPESDRSEVAEEAEEADDADEAEEAAEDDEAAEDERRGLLRRDRDRPGLRERLRQRRDQDRGRARRFANRGPEGGFLFQLLDADDDQQLTKEEVVEGTNLAVAKLFELVDENEDEALDPDELGTMRRRMLDRDRRLGGDEEDAYDAGEAELDIEIGASEQEGGEGDPN